MVVIDIIRCFVMKPVLDFSTNDESKRKNHKHFNRAFQFFMALLMLLVIIAKCGSITSFDSFMDLFTILIIVYLGAFGFGILIQIVQCLEKTNQPEVVKDINSPVIEFKGPKRRGRTSLPRIEEGDNPMKDDIAKSALDEIMIGTVVKC